MYTYLSNNFVEYPNILFYFYRISLRCVPVVSTTAATSIETLKVSWFKLGIRQVRERCFPCCVIDTVMSQLTLFCFSPHNVGTGKGGTSIWGRKFEDEYSEHLKVSTSLTGLVRLHRWEVSPNVSWRIRIYHCDFRVLLSFYLSIMYEEWSRWRTMAPTRTAPSFS